MTLERLRVRALVTGRKPCGPDKRGAGLALGFPEKQTSLPGG